MINEKIARLREENSQLKAQLEGYQNGKNKLIEKHIDEVEELKEENANLREQIVRLKSTNLKQAEKLLDSRKFIADAVDRAIKRYDKQNLGRIEELKSNLKEMTKVLDTVDNIIETRLKFAHESFMKQIEGLNQEMEQIFYEELKIYLSKKLNIKSTADRYVQRKLKSAISDYRTKKLDILIKSIYSRMAKKYNVCLSKAIVKEIHGMSLIQEQTMKNCSRLIAEKEQKFLAELEEDYKPMLLDKK